jgi:type I restriction enzyme S subunit
MIDRFFSITDEVEKATSLNMTQIEILRQSILKKAFSGTLVPQDPTDEPAEKLLEQIKAEHFNNRKSKIDNQLELTRYVK